MSLSDRYKPRLSIELSREQFDKLQSLIPWGQKRQIFSPIVDDIIRLTEEHGQTFLAALIARAINLEDFSNLNLKGGIKDDHHR